MAVRAPWKIAPRRSPSELEREEDRSLATLASEGDEGAFEAIFERHHRGLLTLSWHMLGSREEAEDALQHTFAAAYRQLVQNGPPEHMRAWLYATARNRCWSILRARRELPHGDVPEGTAWLPDEVERRSDLRDLLEDIERLPEEQRVALVLAEIEDLDHAEIAEVLGCRRDKVRALVFQARSTLGGWREARATPCREVREELAIARGPELRRAHLRRHLAVCRECSAFREDVDQQRRRVALLLPPIPIALALKEGMIEAAIAGAAGGGAGGAAAAGAAAGGGGGGAAGAAGGAAAGGAAAGGAAAGGAAAGGGIATAVKVGAAALIIGGGGVAGFAGLGGGGADKPSQSSAQPEPTRAADKAEPVQPTQAAAKPAAKPRPSKKKAKADKRLKASEQTQQATVTESVEEATAPVPVAPAASTPEPPSPPATPEPPPPAQAPLKAQPETPSVQSEGEVQAVPPPEPPDVVP